MSKRQAPTQPVVEHFREILFMPFQVKGQDVHLEKSGRGDWDGLTAELTRQMSDKWERQEDWYARQTLTGGAQVGVSEKDRLKQEQAERDARFSEFVYFQPYVQRLLYRKPNQESNGEAKDAATVAIYTRKDVEWVVVQLLPGADAIRLDVCQIHLLWLSLGAKHGVGLLMLEVALPHDSALPLKVAEDFLDSFRRLYPPYWQDKWKETEAHPGRFPYSVCWGSKDKRVSPEFRCDREEFENLRAWSECKRRPPLARHWRWLLAGDSEVVPLVLDQIEDERMPTMAFLAFDNPRKLSRGDFIRLCLADDSGLSNTLPYAPDFLATFEQEYCYDRFWDDDGLRKGTDWLTTRHMNCGYAYTLVGSSNNDMFMDGNNGILSHFRRHYMVMALLTHFQRAALLSFSNQMSHAFTQHGNNPKDIKAFRIEAERVLKQILDFTDSYWFPELTTQVQGRELYALWRKHLNLQELYDQMMQEAREVTAFLGGKAAKQTSDRIGRAGVLMAVAGALTAGVFGYLKDDTKPDLGGMLARELVKLLDLCPYVNIANGIANTLLGIFVAGTIIYVVLRPCVMDRLVKMLFPEDDEPKQPK